MYEVTGAAARAIGPAAPRDKGISPDEHAGQLPPQAGPLQRVLRGRPVQRVADEQRRAGDTAAAAQRVYKRVGTSAILARLVVVAVGAVMLAAWPLKVFSPTANLGLVVVQLSALAYSYLARLWLSYAHPFEAWQRKRGEAELLRTAYFGEVVRAAGSVQEGELPLLPLQLEYFRRYQLELQKGYYARRAEAHARRAGMQRSYRLLARVAVVLLLMAGIVYSLLSMRGIVPMVDYSQQYFGASIVMLMSGISSALASVSLMSFDERNAVRYRTMAENLAYLAGSALSEARTAAAQGDPAPVLDFVRRVHELMSVEHREWLLLHDIAPLLEAQTARNVHMRLRRS
jgi:hypothetical protein